MKYLFIIPNYHQNADSTAIVSKEYVSFLLKENNSVTVLSFDNFNLVRKPIEKEDNLKVINLLDERSLKAYKHSKEKSYFELSKFLRMTIQLKCKARRLFKVKTNEWPLDSMSYEKIFKYLDDEYDYIISTSSPFFSHVFASILKKKGFSKKWVAMLWDPYVYNATMTNRLSIRKKAAKKTFKNVDKIYCSDGVIEGNISIGFKPEYLSKCFTIKYPGITPIEQDKNIKVNNHSLLFTGTFYPDIRNPKKMFDVLDKLGSEYSINLYSKGCEELVEEKTKQEGSRYFLHPQVSKDKVSELIYSNSFILNLGNTITNQIPAKVFELISSGKPIINFYFDEKDPSLKYFNQRPLCFNLNLDCYDDNDINNLIEFVQKNEGKCLSFDESTKNLQEYKSENALNSFFEDIEKI